MSKEYQFIEQVDPTKFRKLAYQEGVKSHFLGSAQYGKVAERRGRIVHSERVHYGLQQSRTP